MSDTCVGKRYSNDLRKSKRCVESDCTLNCCPKSSEMFNGSTPFQYV